MTRDWPIVRAGDVLQLQRRWIKPAPLEEYVEIGVRSFGRGIFHKQPVTGLTLGDKRVLRICPGDLVFMNVFAWEGAVAVAGLSEEGTIGSHRFATYTPLNGNLDPRFLQLYFQTEAGRELLGRVSPGSAGRNRTMNLAQFANERLPLPPIEEQRRIVAGTDALATRVAHARQLVEQTEEASCALFDQSAARLFASCSAPTVRVDEIVDVRGGGTPSKGNPLYWEGDLPWVSPKDMKRREVFGAIDHISEEASESCSAKELPVGSVLVVVRGMILAHTFPSAVLRVPAAINQDMKALVPGPRVLPEYLCAAFWALNRKVLALVDKSTHDTRKLLTEKLAAFELPLPPVPEQRRLVADFDKIQANAESVRSLHKQTAAELDALMRSIFDRAFKGEL